MLGSVKALRALVGLNGPHQPPLETLTRTPCPWSQELIKAQAWAFDICLCVLVLAGIELIFFRVAGTGPWFGFVLATVLITQGCFRYRSAALTQSQGLCCSSPHPTSEQAGGAQEAGRGHSPDS